MAYEVKDMSGSIGQNYSKKEPKHPDINGKCLIDGKEYLIAGWEKQGKNGNTFYSLKFQVPRPRDENAAPKQPAKPMFGGNTAAKKDDFNDDIDF